MADINRLAPIIFGWEGNWANDPVDKGGATMMGVTLNTWKSCGYDKDGDGDIDIDDLKIIDKADVVYKILKPHYWDRWKADLIKNQSIANILVDWVWASGKWGIVIPQKILGVEPDGLVSAKGITLNVLNSINQKILFDKIKSERKKFVCNIVEKNESQRKFIHGWLNRIESFNFKEK